MNDFMMAVFHTLMGMGTVFVVLIFISLIISLFVYIPVVEGKIKSVFRRSEKENVNEKAEMISNVQEIEESNLTNDQELVAVIMAAIVASSDGAVSADKLVVRSIRRVKRR